VFSRQKRLRAALFITHGGMNSVNEGLAFDVPLLLIPQGADQFLIAWRIQQVGAGVSLRNPSPGQLRDTAEELLATPAYREQSVKLGAALRTAGGPSVAADAIEAYSRSTP
jgi:UDP:flavonoid glycosyltransferase YjiC (YdhE family)